MPRKQLSFSLDEIKQRLKEAEFMTGEVLKDPKWPSAYRNDIP